MTDITAVRGTSSSPEVCQPYWDKKSSKSFFTKGFESLDKLMIHLSKQAKAYYKDLEAKTELSKEAGEHLSELEKLMAQVGNSNKKVKLSAEARAFLEKNVALPEGWQSWDGEYGAEDLFKAKQQLQAFNTAQTDFVAESQLKAQRIMSTYNNSATFLNSLQSMLAELNKMIIQTLR